MSNDGISDQHHMRRRDDVNDRTAAPCPCVSYGVLSCGTAGTSYLATTGSRVDSDWGTESTKSEIEAEVKCKRVGRGGD